MKRALFAATALTLAAFALSGAQAADTNTAPKGHTGYFERLDANKDGAITQDEAVAARHARFAKMGANSDGKITQAEFMAYSSHPKKASAQSTDAKTSSDAKTSTDAKKASHEARKAKMFGYLDADKDGKVTKDEMASARERFHKKHRGGADAQAKPSGTQSN
jgi:Ca2+-binding EF-hand superfamily protein